MGCRAGVDRWLCLIFFCLISKTDSFRISTSFNVVARVVLQICWILSSISMLMSAELRERIQYIFILSVHFYCCSFLKCILSELLRMYD